MSKYMPVKVTWSRLVKLKENLNGNHESSY